MSEDLPAIRRAAKQARARRDWVSVLDHAGTLCAAAPDEAMGHVLAVLALRGLGRAPQMRARLHDALTRFPDHPTLQALRDGDTAPPEQPEATAPSIEALQEDAQQAAERADWPALEARCAALMHRDPRNPLGFALGAQAARKQRRMRRAVAISRAGLAAFPDHPAVLAERAMVLHRVNQLDEAARCFARLRAIQPDDAFGYSAGAMVLAHAAQFEAADAVLQAGLARWPDDLELVVQSADLAGRRGDTALARLRWERVRTLARDDPRPDNFAATLILARQFDLLPEAMAAEDGALGCAEGVRANQAHVDDGAVLKHFEGLGGDCEFGLVQRLAGIEPLGLLRFAGITAEQLIAMLEADLHGVGEEAHTEVFLNMRQEYMLRDTRYFFAHTLIDYGTIEPAALLMKLRARTAFLASRLRADLRRGSRVFIFRPVHGAIDDATLHRLHAAIRRAGPAALLCVRDAAGDDAAPALSERDDGLLLGRLPATPRNGAGAAAERYAAWLAICRAALALRKPEP